MSARHRLVRTVAVLLVGAVLTVAGATAAFAGWTSSGTGSAAGRALVMPAGIQPTVTSRETSVAVRWAAATFPGGAPVAGYIIHRYDANGVAQTVGAGCNGVVASTSCVETNLPPGTWTYTDTPVQGNWTGTESPASASTTTI